MNKASEDPAKNKWTVWIPIIIAIAAGGPSRLPFAGWGFRLCSEWPGNAYGVEH